MRRLSRDAWMAVGLFITLAIFATIAAVQETRENAAVPALAGNSNAPDGARALALWLDELGYFTTSEVTAVFSIPQTTDMILMLEPWPSISNANWEIVDKWVDNGGTLVVAGTNVGTIQAFQHYDFTLRADTGLTQTVTIETPLFASPAIMEPELLNGRFYLQSSRPDFVTHVALNSQPAVVSMQRGEGRVILSSWIRPFTNAGLTEPGHPELVLNILSTGGAPGTVWFDEWHHGVRPDEASSANNWLQRTPVGRSFLYVALLILVALVLRGQLFGRPVPLPHNMSRRAPLEHITAIANLSRRAGHKTAVLQDYHHRLKRHLGHRYRLSPTLPDNQFVPQLAAYQPNLDIAALTHLLQRLSQTNISEGEMVQLAAETSAWLKQ